jgi:hypothetical protein
MNAVDVRLVFRAAKPVLPCGQHKHYHPERCGLQQQKTAGQDSPNRRHLSQRSACWQQDFIENYRFEKL